MGAAATRIRLSLRMRMLMLLAKICWDCPFLALDAGAAGNVQRAMLAAQQQNAARECQRQGHTTRSTTCSERAQSDSEYREGWYCDGCNKYSPFSGTPFQRCDTCGVDFCDRCLDQDAVRGGSDRRQFVVQQQAPLLN